MLAHVGRSYEIYLFDEDCVARLALPLDHPRAGLRRDCGGPWGDTSCRVR